MIELKPYRADYYSLEDYIDKLEEEVQEVIEAESWPEKCKELLDVIQVCVGIMCKVSTREIITIKDIGFDYNEDRLDENKNNIKHTCLEGKYLIASNLAHSCYSELVRITDSLMREPNRYRFNLVAEHKEKLKNKEKEGVEDMFAEQMQRVIELKERKDELEELLNTIKNYVTAREKPVNGDYIKLSNWKRREVSRYEKMKSKLEELEGDNIEG